MSAIESTLEARHAARADGPNVFLFLKRLENPLF